MRTVHAKSLLTLAAVLAVSSPAWSADEPAKPVIKTYDLADLLRPARDYPLPEPASGKSGRVSTFVGSGGGAAPAANAGGDEQPIKAYSAIIREFVAVGSWKEDGGAEGTIVVAPSNTSLIISHTAEVHQQIEALLKQLRKQSSTSSMVRVRASWMIIPPAAVDALYASQAGGKSVTDVSPIAADDDKRMDEVLKDAEVYRQAQMTCYNGQTVGVSSGREEAYVSDLSPVVGTNAVGYDPTVDTAFSGVRLQLTPQLIPNENRVVLDLQSRVTETTLIRSPVVAPTAGSATTRPFDEAKVGEGGVDGPADAGPGSASNAIAFIQRPQVSDQPFSTTVRVPLGSRVIVGGMTLPPETAKGKTRTLYLVVRVDAVQ